jgi:hypothetical protein
MIFYVLQQKIHKFGQLLKELDKLMNSFRK